MLNQQYLTFRLYEMQYGIEASLVQEMFPLPELTPIAEATTDMIGILNLRGQIVPIMHLESKNSGVKTFRSSDEKKSANSLQGNRLKECNLSDYVIVFYGNGLQIGLVVHQVNEVLELNAEVIETEAYLEPVSEINSAFIAGVANLDTDQVFLLNINKLISQTDAILTLIWDAQMQLDLKAASPISDVEQQINITAQPHSLQGKAKFHAPLFAGESLDKSYSPPSNKAAPFPSPRRGGLGRGGEGLGKRLTELQTPTIIPSFYDLYCPDATPEERAIFRQRADHLKQLTESLNVTEELISLAVIGFSNEYFGLDLELVREFTNIRNLTRIPGCPKHIVGNMNLRGEIVTLIDIRNVLNIPTTPVSVGSQAVVVQIDNIIAGFPVDRVLEMVYLNSADMTPLPTTLSTFGGEYLRGTAFFEEKILKVLDLPKIFTQGGLAVDEEA